MKNLPLIDEEQQLSLESISLLEEKISAKLPLEYKSYLLLHNGGHPLKDFYPLINSKLTEEADVAWFLAFYDGEYENLVDDYNTYKNRIPQGFVPIARGSGGDLVCLCVEGLEYGKLYFWNHDWEADEGEEVTFDNTYLIANSFTDFINSLYGYELEKDKNGKDVEIRIHDKYSLPFSTQAKKYGYIVTDFFAQAPSEVEDYIITEIEATKDIVLSYKVPSSGKEYQRVIDINGKVKDIF